MTQEQPTSGQRQDYLAYLLRLWRENAGDAPGGETARWRASLEDPHSGEKRGFAHLDELAAFLRQRTGLAPPVEGAEGEGLVHVDSEPEEGGVK